MNIPGFDAESSLGPTMGIYRGKAVFGRFGTVAVSMQQFGTFPGGFGETMRCCGYSSLLHRFVCITRTVSPLEQCECRRNSFGPYIICRPPIASPD